MNRRDFIKAAGVATLGLMIDGQNFVEARRSPAMKISAVKLFDSGFMMKSFACGGGLPAGSIKEEKLRSSLQNYVIDTGKEVILVDTGFPAEETVPVTKDSVITFGDKVNDYVEALKAAGVVKNGFDAVKILGNGKIEKKLTVKLSAFSESAKAAIEAAGGKAEVI